MNTFKTENYCRQAKDAWPCKDNHIIAQFDADSIVVYQAFNHSIANFAVENQR